MARVKRRKNLSDDFIDIGVSSIIGGMGFGMVNASPLPDSLKQGTGALIGVSILKKSTKLL